MALQKQPYRGTRDFFPADMRLRNYIFGKMSEASELFSYEPYDGPLLEEVELYLAKSGEELINDQIYAFTDRGDRRVAIRPEMTPTVARMVAQIHREVAKPLRWYSIPNLMRYEKPQKGRLREFWQYNADIFGADVYGEIEILQLSIALLKSFGANESHFEILLNDRRVVDAIFNDFIGLTKEEASKLYKVVDKVKKINQEALEKMTKEIVQDDKAQRFYQYLNIKNFSEMKIFLQQNNLSDKASEFLRFITLLEEFNLDAFVKYDASIVRGLDYYTGIVFEIFDKHPENRRAIAGGGAYANLLQIFNEPALGGVGIGLGEVPLTEFLKAHNLMKDFSKPAVTVLISYQVPEAESASIKLAQDLRDSGFSTEVIFGETKNKKVFTHSDRKLVKFVTFMGAAEVESHSVQIKDMTTKDSETIPLSELIRIILKVKGNA